MMRQFRVWCPEFSESESDGAVYDVQIMYDAVEQYLEDHADGEDEAAAAQGYEFKIHARRQGTASDGALFPIIIYNMTGDYGFVWSGDIADDEDLSDPRTKGSDVLEEYLAKTDGCTVALAVV